MKIIGLMLLTIVSCFGQVELPLDLFDQYGGAKWVQCTEGEKALWYREKIGNRWWFCTPDGHGFWLQSIWSVLPPNSTLRGYAKTGGSQSGDSSSSWYPWIIRRMSDWGFNAFDQYSSRRASPTGNGQIQLGYKTAWPVIMGEKLRPSRYGIINEYSFVLQPIKQFDTSTNWDTTPTGVMTRTDAMRYLDIFDTSYREYLLDMMNDASDNHTNHVFTGTGATEAKRAWVFGWTIDDTDWMGGMGAGPDFATGSDGTEISGRKHAHAGLVTLYAAPTMAAMARDPVTNGTSGLILADPRTNVIDCEGAEIAGAQGDDSYATGAVSTTEYPSDTVCAKRALVKFLQDEYGTIAALNTAWGSSYTTFGTTGTAVSDQLVATGNDTVTVSFTVPSISTSNQIVPFSVRVYIDDVFVAADVRHLSSIMSCRNATGTTLDVGHIWGPILSGNARQSNTCLNPVTNPASVINYQTGAITLRFDSALSSSSEIRLDYVVEGWGRGTGLLDEAGHNAWSFDWKTNSHSMTGADVDFKRDMDEFLYRFMYKYFTDMRRTLYGKYTSITGCDPDGGWQPGVCPMYFGPSYLGTWSGVGYAQVVAAFADAGGDAYPYYSWPDWMSDYAERMEFLYTYWGDKPVIVWEAFTGDDDSDLPQDSAAQVRPKSNTQADRGAQYKAMIQALQSSQNAAGTYWVAGVRFWRLDSNVGEGNSWGLSTLNDDPFDGYCPGPGTRYEKVPGGTPITTIAVTDGVGVVTTRTGPTGPYHGLSVGSKVRIMGATASTDVNLNGVFPVTAIAANNYTIGNVVDVPNDTYTEATIKLEYALYPCGGSNSSTAVHRGKFGDFITHVKDANSYWYNLVQRPRAAGK